MGWDTTGCTVTTGKESASSILFARSGSRTVYQKETVTTQVIRGLTEAGGIAKIPSSSDETTQKTYYALIDDEVFTLTATTGTKVDYSGSRVDETGQWQVTIRTTEYAIVNLDTSVWSESKINSDGVEIDLSSTGIEKFVSYDASTSYVFTYAGDTLFSTNKCTVKERRYIDSYANAVAIANANTSNGISYKKIQRYILGGGSYWVWLPIGTETHAAVTQGSDGEGWTVTITSTEHGWTGSGWSD